MTNPQLPPSDKQIIKLPTGAIDLINGIGKVYLSKNLVVSIIIDVVTGVIKDTLIKLITQQQEQACAFPVFPGENLIEANIPSQLSITFKIANPQTQTEKNYKTQINIPYPKDCNTLDWCKDIAPMTRTVGNIMAVVRWENTTMQTSCVFDTEDHALKFMKDYVIPLSTLKPVKNDSGDTVRIVKNVYSKRKPKTKALVPERANFITFDPDTGLPMTPQFLKPPANGC